MQRGIGRISAELFIDRGDSTDPNWLFNQLPCFCWESSQHSDEFLCIWVERSKFAQLVKPLEGEVHNEMCSHAGNMIVVGRKEEEIVKLEKTQTRSMAIAFRVQIFGIYREIIDL